MIFQGFQPFAEACVRGFELSLLSLYKIEEMIHDKTPEEKYEERQKQSRPIMEALFEWLHTMEDSVDRSSLIGDAILYTLNQEVYLKRYLEDVISA